jgi:hypothetical protein
MSFEKNKYHVIKNAISKELADFCYKYFINKRKVAKHMFDTKFISPFTEYFGTWGDKQVPNTYSHYADIVMETLLIELLPVMEKETNKKLSPTYSYARIYKKDDVLEKHKDRFSCEISTTLNLGGDPWPIYLEPDPSKGKSTPEKYIPSKSKGKKINLKPGDMLIYRGCELEHWRNAFKGENCGQVFLHYNDTKSANADQNKFDGRPLLGLPSWYKNQEV